MHRIGGASRKVLWHSLSLSGIDAVGSVTAASLGRVPSAGHIATGAGSLLAKVVVAAEALRAVLHPCVLVAARAARRDALLNSHLVAARPRVSVQHAHVVLVVVVAAQERLRWRRCGCSRSKDQQLWIDL